jgi:2,3-bisphosphoglycerate-independent phosphoglycerate mutase
MILDGWGINTAEKDNAVAQARTPCLDKLKKQYPNTRLSCSGAAVGLPPGIMGNSEVGHLNIGAGRVVYQDLLRINHAIEDGTFFENAPLAAVMDKVADEKSALHLMGLVSDGGVHSQLTHLTALLDMARRRGLDRVYVHAILDGRDTPPESGAGYIKVLQKHIQSINCGVIATVCGRFYAMDRDTRWDRVEQAYRLYTGGRGRFEKDPVSAVEQAYGRGETDEFVKPMVMTDDDDTPLAVIKDNDGLIFFNYRADRAREITRAFTADAFDGFDRENHPQLCDFVCMTLYDEAFSLPMAFGPVHLDNILGEVVSHAGLHQLRIAETEKYAHVTYFFNGGEEQAFVNEDRCLVPSPRSVSTYDQKPEMSAYEVADELVARLDSDRYDFVAVNFANMDMVGHTGILAAAIRACEVVDDCVARVVARIRDKGGAAIIIADHGNAEKMVDKDGHPHTAHTLNQVPCILVDDSRKNARLKPGRLCDVAPTILAILGLDQPVEMTGKSLVEVG